MFYFISVCQAKDRLQVGRIQVIAFQSSDGKQNNMSRAIVLSPVNKTTVIDVESSLSSSENLSVRSGSARAGSPEQDTGDSKSVAGSWKVHIFTLILEFMMLDFSCGALRPTEQVRKL